MGMYALLLRKVTSAAREEETPAPRPRYPDHIDDADIFLQRLLERLPGNLMIEAAREGQGVAVTAGAFVEADIAAGRLRLLFEDRRKKGYFIVTRPGPMRADARKLHRWIRAQASEAAAG